jgi:hypothetical protein
MRGKKAIVKKELFTERGNKKRLNQGEVVTILSTEADPDNKVSVTSTMRYYPIHNVPLEILEIQ